MIDAGQAYKNVHEAKLPTVAQVQALILLASKLGSSQVQLILEDEVAKELRTLQFMVNRIEYNYYTVQW